MKWLPLHLRRQVHLSSYMFKIIKGQCPTYFINKFTFISGGSRDGSNCNSYTPRSTYLKNLSYLGAKAWNILPTTLRSKDDSKVFGKMYKMIILESIENDSGLYAVNNSFDYLYRLSLLNL